MQVKIGNFGYSFIPMNTSPNIDRDKPLCEYFEIHRDVAHDGVSEEGIRDGVEIDKPAVARNIHPPIMSG